MQKNIKPAVITGALKAPPSKSMMQRAVACALLSEGITTIENPSLCDDSLAAIDVVKRLGADVEMNENSVVIKSGGIDSLMKEKGEIELDCGESGLCLRMFAPIAAITGRQVTLTGKGSLMKRPVDFVCNAIGAFGGECSTNSGYPPIKITGQMPGGSSEIDGSVSSQHLTGLLMALPNLENDSIIPVKNLASKQYINMTLDALRQFGIDINNENYSTFHITGGQSFNACHYIVEGDWSGAAFLLVAGAIAGEIEVAGLDSDSHQPDKNVLQSLDLAGARVSIKENAILVEKNELKAFDFDAADSPDLFPPLAALACFCAGTTRIKGADRLVHKESNRAEIIMREFYSLGAVISVENNIMTITGGNLRGGTANSHNDHRIAMALSIAGLRSETNVTVENTECTVKSYPGFFEDLNSIAQN